MSLANVAVFARELPPRLRDDVLSYARCVQDALPEIFREARVEEDRDLGDQLVFLAGVKKLHALCSGTFWILDNSLRALRQSETEVVRLGSLRIARGSDEWRNLHDMLQELERILAGERLLELVQNPSYREILVTLHNER